MWSILFAIVGIPLLGLFYSLYRLRRRAHRRVR
jgi:hypothetical protein